MYRKEDILNAWIMIERLSEGSTSRNDRKLKPLEPASDGWHAYFSEELAKHKRALRISDKKFKASGLVFYFDIFSFQEIIDILRKKYRIKATCEETNSSDKFTFSTSFDSQLNFVASKFFFTASGYIRKHKDELPEDFLEMEKGLAGAENTLKTRLDAKFSEGDFNTVVSELFQHYDVSPGNTLNFRYKFCENLNADNVALHSFFIKDLEKAKKENTENLNRYLNGFSGDKLNLGIPLDLPNGSPNFDSRIFEEILRPKLYPLGRFPSNPDHALSFMQQVAVNLALNENDENNGFISVNGPPGTGKTTLLKDIFAELVVRQAALICELPDKAMRDGLIYEDITDPKDKKTLGTLPGRVSNKNIIVASSNNGAVQNIVNELPKIKDISEHFQKELANADYFKSISNLTPSAERNAKRQKISTKRADDKNWGLFSMEGGNRDNVSNLLLNIKHIEDYLDHDHYPDSNVYQEFSSLYAEAARERERTQKYSEVIGSLPEKKKQYERQNQEMTRRRDDLTMLQEETKRELETLRQEEDGLRTDFSEISYSLANLDNELLQAERHFDVVGTQKPGFFWFHKLFGTPKGKQFFDKLNDANEALNDLFSQKKALLNRRSLLEKASKKNVGERTSLTRRLQEAEYEFGARIAKQESDLRALTEEIAALEEFKAHSNIEALDFLKSYGALQQSNPWFAKEFRIFQSKLFISALKVRKQFLFENKEHLKAARNIYKERYDYVKNGASGQLVAEAWQWLNFAIPVVSTTFASFRSMFHSLPENSIGNLFIDEAGQALPQAAVGAIFRSKRVMAVGDPSQIKPVLTLDSEALCLIRQNYKVSGKFISGDASAQTLADEACRYGFLKNGEDGNKWVGIPLWVHRRSNYPMFTISNTISYGGMMVQGIPEDKARGKSEWLDSTGEATDKFVKEQAELLKHLISERLRENPELAKNIYVISPFNNVAGRLANELIAFKDVNVGTVHKFQGKEAKIVYLVLGADKKSEGAARWAVSEPNIMNVAATRAKEEFYVIGDKRLYKDLKSKVANATISIIDRYNEQAARKPSDTMNLRGAGK
jgi:superfamily I DNA and/or RNA helicase